MVRRFPAEYCHRYVIGSVQVSFHLLLQIVERIETEMIVKPFLIVTVTAFHFPVVPRRSRPKDVMPYTIMTAKHVKWMNAFRFGSVSEFGPTVCLYLFWSIAKPMNRSFDKVNGGIT